MKWNVVAQRSGGGWFQADFELAPIADVSRSNGYQIRV